METLLGIVVGALVTWFAADRYYKKATKDLNEAVQRLTSESEELKRLSLLLMRALEGGGHIELARDAEGNPVGLQHQLEATLRAQGSLVAGLATRESLSENDPVARDRRSSEQPR